MIVVIIALLILPTLAHLTFSWIGYNPTDDGFNLALSRRIIDGQVPHRDFISVRPVLSPILHIPSVLLFGDHTYWLSRMVVWFQFFSMAWIWVLIVNRFRSVPMSEWEKLAGTVLFVIASAHNWNIMAWHTVDALWISSIGIWLVTTVATEKRWVGYLVISLSYLCKQNFFLVPPITCLILGDLRPLRNRVAILAPGLTYIAVILLLGGLADAQIQLLTHSSPLFYATAVYVLGYAGWGALLGYVAVTLLSNPPETMKSRLTNVVKQETVGMLFFGIVLIPLAYGLSLATWAARESFLVWGMLVGVIIRFMLYPSSISDEYLKPGLLAVLVAWSGSISVGFNTPVLGSGAVALVLFSYGYQASLELKTTKALHVSLVIMLTLVFCGFLDARFNAVYLDQPAWRLKHKLSNVLPGGVGIYTNPNTYAFMADLNLAKEIAQVQGKPYAIMPDFPGWWVKNQQPNPLPLDWFWITEVERFELSQRLTQAIESMRGQVIFIIQKSDAMFLSKGFRPFLIPRPEAVNIVIKHFELVGETTFFQLYE